MKWLLLWREPSNMRCSKRWANPVRQGCSFLDPTWYQSATCTTGRRRSSCSSTRSPLPRVRVLTGTEMSRAISAAAGPLEAAKDVGSGTKGREYTAPPSDTSVPFLRIARRVNPQSLPFSGTAVVLVLGLGLACGAAAQPEDLFTADRPVEEMMGKQVVFETTHGSFVIEVLPEKAPNHAAFFLLQAEEGNYDGTAFHRVIARGIVQGGDPLSRDPEAVEAYGTGGLLRLAREPNDERHVRGAVSAVQVPGRPDSAGSQFFLVVTDQPSLDGGYTVFARVVEGIHEVTVISELPANERGMPLERVEVLRATVRDRPPELPPPFSEESDAELANFRVVLETPHGEIGIEMLPETAPNHVRNFLRLSAVGAYDGTAFHRVVPGFVIQTGWMETRDPPVPESIEMHITNLAPEFSDIPHEPGIVSMARLAALHSAMTSFFIVTGPAPELDGEYSVFGRVVSGYEVVETIEALPAGEDEAPFERVEILRARVEPIE